jgi:hypothetical protein
MGGPTGSSSAVRRGALGLEYGARRYSEAGSKLTKWLETALGSRSANGTDVGVVCVQRNHHEIYSYRQHLHLCIELFTGVPRSLIAGIACCKYALNLCWRLPFLFSAIAI